MPIPDYQTIMLPLLKYCGDPKDHKQRDAEEYLATVFKLTMEEREVMLPSRKVRTFYNRLIWSKWYIQKAILLSAPR